MVRLCSYLLASCLASVSASAQVPRFQAVPLPGDEVSFRRDGRELTRFYHAADLDRPFFFPVRASSDASLTRMGHPRDPISHSHHNSVWMSHHDVGGTSFWADRGSGTGQIICHGIEAFEDADDFCAATARIRWVVRDSGEQLLDERRTASVRQGIGETDWFLVIESTFTVPDGRERTVFNTTPFGLIGVRMAKSIGVHDGGGRILNSDGAVNEEAVFRKPARWVDYSGDIGSDLAGGVTLMDAPTNPGHPHPFHVRNDGWMGVCLTLGEPSVVTKSEPMTVRYTLWVHDGVPDADAIENAWAEANRAR